MLLKLGEAMVCACSAAKCVLIQTILAVTLVWAVGIFMLGYVATAVLTRLDAALTYHIGGCWITVLWLILCAPRLLDVLCFIICSMLLQLGCISVLSGSEG